MLKKNILKTFTRAQLEFSLSNSSFQGEVLGTVKQSSLIRRKAFPLLTLHPMPTFRKRSVHWRRFEKLRGIMKQGNSCLFHSANERSQPICNRRQTCLLQRDCLQMCLRLWDDPQLSTIWFVLSSLHSKYSMSDKTPHQHSLCYIKSPVGKSNLKTTMEKPYKPSNKHQKAIMSSVTNSIPGYKWPNTCHNLKQGNIKYVILNARLKTHLEKVNYKKWFRKN